MTRPISNTRQAILDAIGTGVTKRSDIAAATGLDINTIRRHLHAALQAQQVERVSVGIYRVAEPAPQLPSTQQPSV